ncbi:MAG: hypothetical protein B7Z37_25875, partial [Verrucomicrobia bacterium 12-59-8]
MIQSFHIPTVQARSAGIASRWGIRHSACLQAVLFLALLITSASAATVRAYLQPDHAHTGEVVSYVITVQNGTVQNVPQLRLPLQIGMTTGIRVSSTGQATQLAWNVAGTEPGEFVIPPQEILVNGEVVKTNEVRLIVTESAATVPGSTEDPNIPLFQIEVEKTEVYQGEVVPISAILFVPRSSVNVRRVGIIEVNKSDFAIPRFPQQNEESATIINGVGYSVYTYRSTLSALHAGDLKVGPATTELLFEVYDEDTQRQLRGRLPPNLPFGVIMGGTEMRKHVVKSQEVKIKVLPLPAEGKPAHFSGAVGDFNISATATPNELAVGDPLAVDITIDGSGNFEALNAPSLMPPDGWKAYPPPTADGSGSTEAPKPPPVLQPKPQISDILMEVPVKARWLNTAVVAPPLTTSARFWAIQSIPAALVILATLFTWFRRRREESTCGLRGELQLLWRGLEETHLTDRDFLQRAAHFIHRSQPGEIQNEELKQIIHRYETQSFTASPGSEQALGSNERSRILSRLAPLLKRAVLFVAMCGTLSLNAAEPEASPDEVYRQAREALEKLKRTGVKRIVMLT